MNTYSALLETHRLNNTSIMAFNINSINQFLVLKSAVEDLQIPAIVQFSQKLIPYWDRIFGLESFVKKFKNDLLLFHLDHCDSIETLKFCVDSGFSSVMFDGSGYEIHDNIQKSKIAADYAHARGTLIEIELGVIGGEEDGKKVAAATYFDMDELKLLAKSVNYDLLALSIGNSHGEVDVQDIIRPESLLAATEIIGQQYYVLHGGTGLSQSTINEAIDNGVVKINISTELKYNTMNIIRNYSTTNTHYDELQFQDIFDHELRKYFISKIRSYSI